MKLKILLLQVLFASAVYSAYFDTQVPSSVAGGTGLMTRIFIPDTMRYFSSAPVVIVLQGGNVSDNIDTSSMYTRFGFIVIKFNYPGGTGSGGNYDNRGLNCITSLRDIIKFATGVSQDNAGRFLLQITNPVKPAYNNVGLVGLSNGGNITIATAGYFGSDFNLAWILNWESPVGEEMPGAEFGRRGNTNGNPFTNAAYNDTTGNVDYSKLKFSDTVRIYNQSVSYSGGFYYDINGNGVPNRGTDFIINGYWAVDNGILKGIVSARLINEAIIRGVYPSSPPSHIMSLTEAQNFWNIRTGDMWIDSAKRKLPNLMFMVTAGDTDHIQSAKDHPHVFNQYDRFRIAAPRFVRLNPDRSYLEYVTGTLQPAAPDNNAFEVFTRLTIRTKFMPETVSDLNFQSAGICELADRTCSGNTSINLNGVINCGTIGVTNINSEIPALYSLSLNFPNPFNPVTNIKFEIPLKSYVMLNVYDITGRLVETLLSKELSAGTYLASWDASKYSSGVYFYSLVTENFMQTRKMILVK